MSEKEFDEGLKKLYMENEVYMMVEVANLYYEYYKDKDDNITLDFIHKTLHDEWNYTEEEYDIIFKKTIETLDTKYNIAIGSNGEILAKG